MFDISLNPNLMQLVAGKRVAIIGPSPHLVGKNQGSCFDDYDIVCRINDIIPLPNLRKDYGSRTDIMFHNFGTPWMDGLKRKIQGSKQHFDELKMAVCPVILSEHSEVSSYLSWPDNYISKVVNNFHSINENFIPFYWIGVKDYKTIYKLVGAQPNSGMMAILMLSKYPIKELLVSGFTFFAEGTKLEEVYCDGHWDELEASKRNNYGIHSGHGYHANISQINLFKKFIKMHYNLIRVDSKLNDLLQLEHPSVLKL